jgi:hypothetical protein
VDIGKSRFSEIPPILVEISGDTVRDLSNELINLSKICQNSYNLRKLCEYRKFLFDINFFTIVTSKTNFQNWLDR